VALAGFLLQIGRRVLERFTGRIINIHPSLLPAFGGDGCYGLHVHEKALARGVKITGATVHFVNDEIDGGKIIMQKAVEVRDDDTPGKLQRRVLTEAEWLIYPAALETVCAGLADA
jgi:phosphoribosylglycinamide formyltransferase-1